MSKKIKNLIIIIIAIVLVILAYFFLPKNVNESNISAIKEKIFEEESTEEGIYTSESQPIDLDEDEDNTVDDKIVESGIIAADAIIIDEDNTIKVDNSILVREHRGYSIMSDVNPGMSYEDAAGKTGIANITVLTNIIKNHLNNYNSGYGWYNSLKYNTSFFCLQKGQPLAGTNQSILELITKENVNINGDSVGIGYTVADLADRADFEESKTQTTRSNSQYNIPSDDYEFTVADAYIFSYSERKNYQEDRAQIALWLDKGATREEILSGSDTTEAIYDSGKELYHVAKAVQELSTSKVSPTMSAVDDSTGTIIEGTSYKVGPFKMNDYTYGWSDKAVDYTGSLIAGITKVEVKLDNSKTITLGEENFSFTRTATVAGSKCTEKHGEEECNEQLWTAPSADNYFYPTPGSEFYILLPYDLTALQGATKVEKITMTYKYTTAEGEGWDLAGEFKKLTWTTSWGDSTDCTYDCDICYNDGANTGGTHIYICVEEGTNAGYCKDCGGSRSCEGHDTGEYKCNGHHSHNSGCYVKKTQYRQKGEETTCGKEEHTHAPSCWQQSSGYGGPTLKCGIDGHSHFPWQGKDNPGCYETEEEEIIELNCNKKHTESSACYATEYYTDYCQHGYKNGNHGSTKASGSNWVSSTDTCSGIAKCRHGYTDCSNLIWTATEEEEIRSQEICAVKYARVYEKYEECYIANIPLVAKVEINKYIYDVNHSVEYSEYDSTLEQTDARATLSEEQKEANPVYVEYGDFVTYTIDIKNHSAFGVKVKITDIIPTGVTIQSVYLGSTKKDSIEELEGTTIEISGETTAVVTVTVKVEETQGKYVNLARILTRNNGTVDYIRTIDDNGPVVNHSSVTIQGTTSEPKVESRDWYIINDYNASIKKYISGYDSQTMIDNNNNKFTDEENELTDRSIMSEEEKEIKPFQVEKGDIITYTIEVKNDSTDVSNQIASGSKKATAVKPNRVVETLQIGLEYNSISAEVFKSTGTQKDINVSCTAIGNNTYAIDTPTLSNGEAVTLNPGEYIKYTVKVKVIESNMYLYNLSNTAILTRLVNVNNKFIKHEGNIHEMPEVDINLSEQEESSDYVKMKDLVIAGKVWLDKDKDGLMNDSAPMKDIVVKLYSVEIEDEKERNRTLVRTTKTDGDGLYTFGKNENGIWYNGTYLYGTSVIESEQRIPKATGKDSNKNYTKASKDNYIKYYIEYEYDGLKYTSTKYSDNDAREYFGNDGREYLGNDGQLIETVGNDGQKEQKYKIDSNAAEFKEKRCAFDEKYEIIAYNTAYSGGAGDQFDLSYKKEGHSSWLNEDRTRVMTSRSFINKENSTTSYLWLYEQKEDATLPETEYLKYINLGLEERDTFDLSITQDVYEVKTTINGDQMIYEYNQNDYTLGNEILDKEQSDDTGYNSPLYMTGYGNDDSSLLPYIFKIYKSDYNYKASQYNIDTVRDYKGIESELNVEVTYRIRVTNNTTDGQVYAGINEIAEYYDSDFVDLELNSDGTVKTFNIKTKDENGYLVNTPIKVVNAEFVMQDGTRKEATVSDGSLYDVDSKGTQCLFIRSKLTTQNNRFFHGDIVLAPSESLDILITFVVDKTNIDEINEYLTYYKKEEGNIILGDKTNIAEINAYSTYYKKDDGTYYSAGLVDHDSNPGNFEDDLSKYEDDTFKTGIKTELQDVNNERVLTGFVWDDARTKTATNESGVQYIGDGEYDTSKNAIEEAKKNEKVSNKEETDSAIKDMKVQLVEMVSVPGVNSSGNPIKKVYEEVINVNEEYANVEARTNEEGKYRLTGYIPGNYVVKFYYGDNATLDSMLVFNGQDYKSTTYQAGEEKFAENRANPDEVLATLEKQNISDAKDDEIRRLETISYSETITNKETQILRAVEVNEDENSEESKRAKEKVENTKMKSETAEFCVKTEKVESSKTKLSFIDTMTKVGEGATARHQIQNIDFGIEYRPELQVSLDKYIANVKVTTSDSNSSTTATPLIDAKFKEYYGIVTKTDTNSGRTEFLTDETTGDIIKVDKNATKDEIKALVGKNISQCERIGDQFVVTIAGTELDKENSSGLSNLQYVGNIGDTQGFAYLNIDDEIIQGANISIQYLMVANNLSEIDRVSSNLSSLRFKENTVAQAYSVANKYYDQVSYQLGENTGFIESDYSGAQTARNKLFSEYYAYELDDDNIIMKDRNGNDVIYRIKTKDIIVDADKKINYEGYYGRYLGSLYYTGVIGLNDIVAELKIDKILDYIDNDLVFNQSENNGLNGRWRTTTSQELYNSNLVSKISFVGGTASGDEALVGAVDNIQLVDNKNRAFDTSERSNLAILVDDRIKEDYAVDEEDITINKNISRYLLPRYANSANSYGTVNLVASKIISAEELSEDMTYDNIAEIVQYSSVTGRVTSLATTLGNAAFFSGDDTVSEWNASTIESDTSATEKITLTPPTGLGRVQQIVRNTVEGASYTVLIVFAVTIVCVGICIGIRLYRKRPIK